MIAEFPEKLQFLFEPHRYKIAYGGRGAAKSWGIARALLILGTQRPLRILCARETQKSISDSVHALLKDQVKELNLGGYYEVLQSSVRGTNGADFLFAGLKHNINNIKSVESCDIVWVEEAQAVSKGSWDVLIPTIRKSGSEIWASFNPELESDDTYQRFVKNPPPGAKVVKVNWSDNPWFPDVLKAEREHLLAKDPDSYQHIWEGHCKQMLDGAVYANELRAAEADGRITKVPYDATKPVHTFWDLGWADNTCIWFAQSIGFEYRLIDFESDTQKPLQHYLKKLQDRPYIYGTDYLPHDARAKQLGSGRSIEELMRAAGRRVEIVKRLGLADGINAARTIFGQCWFDAEKCADGLQALRHYRYEKDEKLGTWGKEPLHDWASHPADGFRYFGVAMKEPQRQAEQRRQNPINAQYGRDSWMA